MTSEEFTTPDVMEPTRLSLAGVPDEISHADSRG
jgi:hypothetical protein